MRILFFWISIFLFPIIIQAQIGMGEWRMHVPSSKAIDLAIGNSLVMAALESGVVEYDINLNETKLYNDLNGLSDVLVSCIVYESSTRSFFVGYKNGNVDQITSDGSVINIPAVLLSQVNGNKAINKMVVKNGLVYAATGFSVVVFEPNKHEVKDTYYPTAGQTGINDLVFLNDSIYCLTSSKLYKGLASNLFLADPSQWSVDSRVPAPVNANYLNIAVQQNELYVLYQKDGFGGDSIMKITNSGLEMKIGNSFDMEISNFHVENDLFYVYLGVAVFIYNNSGAFLQSVGQYNSLTGAPQKALPLNTGFWVADNLNGLVRYGSSVDYSFVLKEGPPKNEFFSLNGYQDKIVVAGGILGRVDLSYSTAGAYVFEDEAWNLLDRQTQPFWNVNKLWDVGSTAVNPLNPAEVAYGAYCIDALSFSVDNQITQVFSAANSPLEPTTLGNGSVCISATEYDEFGNCWLVNCYSNKPLKVKNADNTWQTFDTGSDTKAVFTGKLAIDNEGNKWFGVYKKGLLAFSDNGTISNTADDRYTMMRSGVGLGNLPSENITAIAVDRDNEIWVGTDEGFAVIYNSASVLDGNSTSSDAAQVLVNFQGNVEILLGSTPITDIEIDGGNRKWIATSNTGIFLISADGQQVLAQYTKENSPLISDVILDMEFNQMTGELFIITDLGLVSLRTDASAEDVSYSTTTVFPNPVKPDYFGPITIQGIRYDSDVKITDIAGNLVYKTVSNGGTATWNGKRLTGEDVSSGVYLIWTTTNTAQDTKDQKVGKVVVIR